MLFMPDISKTKTTTAFGHTSPTLFIGQPWPAKRLSFILKTEVEHSKIPRTLRQALGERAFGMLNK